MVDRLLDARADLSRYMLAATSLPTPAQRKLARIVERAHHPPLAVAFPEARVIRVPQAAPWWRPVAAWRALREARETRWLLDAYPCCLRQGYGHVWQLADRVPLTTHGCSLQPENVADVDLDVWVPVGMEREVTYVNRHEKQTDYVVVLQGPPVACPTCGCPPRTWQRERWQEYVRRYGA